MDIVRSPILCATPFVGFSKEGKPSQQNGKLWLHSAEFGFGFCVAGLALQYQMAVKHGSVVRLEVSKFPVETWAEYSLEDATGISGLADRMLAHLFGGHYDRTMYENIVGHYDLDFDDDEIDDDLFCDGFPEDCKLYYRVVHV